MARYVSIEQRILDSKNSYYVALRQSQSGWHDEQHDVVPWALYLLKIIEDAYSDFEHRVAAGTALVGRTKREQARNYIETQAPRRFRQSGQCSAARGSRSDRPTRRSPAPSAPARAQRP